MLGWIKNRNGTPKKFRLGGWLGHVFGMLAKMKGLRETPLDIFGLSAERRRERKFRDEKLALMLTMAREQDFNAERYDALLEAVLSVRGYGYVKDASMTAAEAVIHDLKSGQDINKVAAE